mmetsp:Transcript_25936/g.32262  ORF Transcript_25936/g.32262 Transcript_25936/m.32262 type:complete len:226 (-) Transcript_25936:427-1104(-)
MSTQYRQDKFVFSKLKDESCVSLESLFSKRQKIVFECLYMPPADGTGVVTSRHIMLCVSGFLSESGAHKKSWEHMVTMCRVANIPIYSVKWEAKGYDIMENVALDQAKQNLTKTQGWGDLLTTDGLNGLGSFVGNTMDKGTQHFLEARGNAKVTGKLLAHFLAMSRENSPLFGDHTFSLMGFSLGAQVVKSAINRLRKLGKEQMLHNVYFLAAAIFNRTKDKMKN